MEPTIIVSKQNNSLLIESKNKKSLSLSILIIILGSFVITASIIFYKLYTPPSDYIRGKIIKIENGDTISEISDKLFDSKIISSKLLFKFFVKLNDVENKMQQGDYIFEKEENVNEVVMRISSADFGIESKKILIREGLSRDEISKILETELPLFLTNEFMKLTSSLEGYLFPDTYIFLKTATTSFVISKMRDNFDRKTGDLKIIAQKQNLNWDKIINIASLIELEGKTLDDRRMIADIIFRRLEMNMPLQLDAPFLYFMNKASLQLTQSDLFSNSPYNTYRNKGLPPTPICNPGIESIESALNPKPNEFLYYLSDKNGNIYYAKTFEEHKKNKKKYLNSN